MKLVPIDSKLVSELQTVDAPFCNKNKKEANLTTHIRMEWEGDLQGNLRVLHK